MDPARTDVFDELDEAARLRIVRTLAGDGQDLGMLLFELAGVALAQGKTRLANWLFNSAFNQEHARGRQGGEVAVASLKSLAETSLKIDNGDALSWSRRLLEVAPDDETHGLAEQLRKRAVKAVIRRAARPENSPLASSNLGLTDLEPVASRVSFQDVGGLDAAKDALQRFMILPQRHPVSARRFGIEAGGGMLLYGPPGCGKSLIAEAVAGEMGVPIIKIRASDMPHPLFGFTEVFKAARKASPCVLFIDALDALVQPRDAGFYQRSPVNNLLKETGALSKNEGVVLIGATNQISRIDTALMRPGRFGRTVEIPRPDAAARTAIWGQWVAGAPCSSDVDVGLLVELSDGLTGADITEIAQAATEAAWMQSLQGDSDREIGIADLLIALRRGFADGAVKERIDQFLTLEPRELLGED